MSVSTEKSQMVMSQSESSVHRANGLIRLTEDAFGMMTDPITKASEIVRRFTWTHKNGTVVQAVTYGATITTIQVPDKNGDVEDVVLGFDDIEGYHRKDNPYFGATVGRVCNRIANGHFLLNGKDEITVAKNWNGLHHLHGGVIGFDKYNWKAYVDGTTVVMSHFSKDGDEGYPGGLLVHVTYKLEPDNSFSITFSGMCSKPTPVNLTNHSYFNLAGHGAGPKELYKHIVTINADKYTVTDDSSIPTGKLRCVGGTPFDLRVPHELGPALDKLNALGFDDNFCVTQGTEQKLTFVARVIHPPSGRAMEVYSDQPGVQFYTSNFLPAPGVMQGKKEAFYQKHGAFCLETQKYPDSVNHANFPSSILNPAETYSHRVVFKFCQHRDD